jgi:hypothetical protein
VKRAFSNLCNTARDHVILVRELFYGDPENLIRAASLSYASDQFQPSQAAVEFVQRALDLAPGNELASGCSNSSKRE